MEQLACTTGEAGSAEGSVKGDGTESLTGCSSTAAVCMQGFNEEDGKPRKCTEMKQWPYHEFLKEQGMHKDYFQR